MYIDRVSLDNLTSLESLGESKPSRNYMAQLIV